MITEQGNLGGQGDPGKFDEILTTDDPVTELEVAWSRFGDAGLPPLAKMPAVSRAIETAVDGVLALPERFAEALAYAAVDPTRLRAVLRAPTRVVVAGGWIDAIDVDLYVPALVPLPTNTRTIDNRRYQFGGASADLSPLTGPTSEPGTSYSVDVTARSPAHALNEISRARDFIMRNNPLRTSIEARGIMMPVTAIFMDLRHEDGHPSVPLLATADGSSRICNALQCLGIDRLETIHYEFPTNRDLYRRYVGSVAGADPNGLDARAQARLRAQKNALITPARVFLRFTPAEDGDTRHGYARAISAYVGMLHVDPPRPWTATGKLEAMAESVISVLRENDELPDHVIDYLSGLLTVEQAEASGLPAQRDAQAAYVLSVLLNRRSNIREAVERGITDVTAAKSATPQRRADVVAELALRATRSAAATGDDPADVAMTAAMRAPYLRATRMAEYTRHPWHVRGYGLDQLLAEATAELRRSSGTWSARLELAALAQYHLTRYGALKREAYGDPSADLRGPQDVLKAMLGDLCGLRLLHRAIVNGRAGLQPVVVDVDGKPVVEIVSGIAVPVVLTDMWLRYEGYPSQTAPLPPSVAQQEPPEALIRLLKSRVLDRVRGLRSEMDSLKTIERSTLGPLIEREGWPAVDTRQALEVLDETRRDLEFWARVADRRASSPTARTNGFSGDDVPMTDEDE
ncbi:hypothetical protein ABIA35_004200 [Catenulispora sp. MAP12-49]|uniref:hypothetical protein n=1 Tax=Catenulispora sp. MAP12-49 TaxID=3156302 RepID=UPI003516DF89